MKEREFGKSFKDDLRMERYDLGGDIEHQASFMQEYTNLLGEARTRKAMLKAKLEMVEGEQLIAVHKNPPEGLKVTADIAKALVASSEAVKAVTLELLEATADENTYSAAVESIKAKGDSLRNAVQLFAMGYFADKTSIKKPKYDNNIVED